MTLPGKFVCTNPGNSMLAHGHMGTWCMAYSVAPRATELWPVQLLPSCLVHQSIVLFNGPEAGGYFSTGQLGKAGG